MAAAVWWIVDRLGHSLVARAIAIGILSHLVLDLATHAPDIALAPGLPIWFGSGLYERAPAAALAVETMFGVLCVWIYAQGRREIALYAFAVIANLLNASMLWPALPGPEERLGGHPSAVVVVVLAQIIATLLIVWALTRRRAH
jgi:hypothetical protein